MTAIKLNSIEALLPEIKTSHLDPVFFEKEQAYLDTDEKQRIFAEGFNKCIKQQGNREITMDREKLIKRIRLHCLKNSPTMLRIEIEKLADAIIANQSEIIKAVKETDKC